MPGLWADGWFYISSAGLLVSGALFFFLLGQYRAAVDAADEVHGEDTVAEPVAPSPVRPLYIPDEPEPAAPLKAATPAPAPVAAAPATDKKDGISGATAPGGISPAVVYLQNLKTQLEEMGSELRGLTKKVSAISDRDEALIERLAELTRVVEELKSGAAPAAAVEAPAPKKARKPVETKPEPAAEPAPVVVAPAPVPVAAPAATPPTVELKIELGAAPGAGAPVNAPEAAPAPDASLRVDDLKAALEQPAPAAEPAEEKPRRGPVWPV